MSEFEKQLNQIIADNITNLLRVNNRTQLELAEYLDVTQATVSNWCNGIKMPRMDKIDKICAFFGVNRSVIMTERKTVSRPLYEAAAGEGRLNDGYPSEEYKIQLEPEEFIVKVVGRSMEPTLQDGDIVIVSAQNVIDHPRQIALVKVNGEESTLKRVEVRDNGIMLIGDNIDVYPPHFYTPEQVEQLPVMIEGVLTKLIREFK